MLGHPLYPTVFIVSLAWSQHGEEEEEKRIFKDTFLRGMSMHKRGKT